MKNSLRWLLILLCGALVLSLPVLLSSPTFSGEVMMEILNEGEGDLDDLFGGLLRLFPSAVAEEEPAAGPAKLPMDFSGGMPLDPDGLREDGYEDDSIRVDLKTVEENGVLWRIAYVKIADPSQLRTATAGKLTSSATALPSKMAAAKNAVVAINGDYFSNDPQKTTFEYRMGQVIRNKQLNRKKDLLIIDGNGDFHTFVKSDKEEVRAFLADGHEIIQAFTFGPALVQQDLLLTMDKGYGYNPNGREPRAAIGQTGALSYVLVVAEGRSEDSKGVTHQELADYMYSLGCREAFNLDGGNSATLIFNGQYFNTKTEKNERQQSDIIYFATTAGMEKAQ